MNKLLTALVKKAFERMGFRISRILPQEKTPSISAVAYNSRKNLHQFYSDEAKVNKYLQESRLGFYKKISELCRKKKLIGKGSHILDAGFGTGHLLRFFIDTFPSIQASGFEYVESALGLGKKTVPDANLFQWDIYQPLSGSYDLILCTEVLEHLEYPEKAIAILLTALNENGALLLTVPEGRKDRFYGHIHLWTPESWQLFLQKNCPSCTISTGLIMSDVYNYAIIQKNPAS